MQFSKDLRHEDGFSKYNTLAVMCAKYDHKSRYFDERSTDTIGVQCGDGHIIAPNGYETKSHVTILHDWNEKYTEAIPHSTKVIALGMFDVPVRCLRLESYPLEDYPVLPKDNHYELLVAGEMDVSSSYNWPDNVYPWERVHLAIHDLPDDEIAKLPYLVSKRSANCSEFMINAYYRSAPSIIHVGSGCRGYLHSLAVKYCKNVHSATGDDSFTPAGILDFLNVLYK